MAAGTLVIVDADPLARAVVRDAVRADGALVVVAEARDGAEALELIVRHRPDAVTLETALPHLDGLALIRAGLDRCPEVRFVVFTAFTDLPTEDPEREALRAGASGYVRKGDGAPAAVAAVHAVLRGEVVVTPGLTKRLMERERGVGEAGFGLRPVRSVLTGREWEVLDLMRGGATTAQIAGALVLSQDTVYTHVKNILRKLGVHTREEAVSAALGLVGAGP